MKGLAQLGNLARSRGPTFTVVLWPNNFSRLIRLSNLVKPSSTLVVHTNHVIQTNKRVHIDQTIRLI